MVIQSNPGSVATLDESKYRYYGITIKKNTNKTPASHIDLSKLADSLDYPIIRRRFEVDQKGKLHIHALMTCPRSHMVSYKSQQRKGWNIYIRKANNLANWQSYCDKDSTSPYEQEQLIHSHAIKYLMSDLFD